MSTSIYKIEYKCDCGIDYGDCDAKCAIILKSNNSNDLYEIYQTDGHKYIGGDKTTKGVSFVFRDSYKEALLKVLSSDEVSRNELTEEENKIIFNGQ